MDNNRNQFKAWTELGHFAKWWGPKGFTLEVVKMDANKAIRSERPLARTGLLKL